jgi:ABC-2 type transport system ATP-binding protein
MERPAILVEGLRKSFGSVVALDGIDLAVRPGTILGLLGPNGAGKTTAVRVLTTLLPPDEGHAEVAGYDVVRDAAALRAAIGLAGQNVAVDESLTGRENLFLVARLYHLDKPEARRRADALLERFELTDAADRPVKTYSGGMHRRLDLAASLVGEPQVLFLDEPTTGLDPRSRLALWEVIEHLVGGGTTLLLTTQYLEEADRLADEIAVIDDGRIIAVGTSDQLKSKVGGEVLEIVVADAARTAEAAQALASLGSAAPKTDPETGRITLPAGDAASVVAEAIRRLDSAGLSISDLQLRRPTLDDVFLELTGHAAETEEPEQEGEERPGRRRRGR